MRLIVAEKPSVASDLGRVLGVRTRQPGILVGAQICITWCLGHMAELCPPQHYRPQWRAWRLDTLPMLPQTFALQVRPGAEAQWQILRRALTDKKVTEVINACDAGREGELIFRWVYALSGCRKKVLRLWLSSLTDQAIDDGYKKMQPSRRFDHLATAAACRSQADWLVGLNATRALTKVRADGVLATVGRVQTPTLALLVARAKEIEAFVPEPFWQVQAQLKATAAPARDYPGTLLNRDKERFTDRQAATAAAGAVRGQAGHVHAVQSQNKVMQPPKLFDLTSLQRHSNARAGYSAERTLALLQSLYERHKLVTYPRTDANYLTEDMGPDIHRALRSLDAPPYQDFVMPLLAQQPSPTPARMICDREVGDHHAIIPTGRKVNAAGLSADEAAIFDMVARRFLANFAPPAQFALTTVKTHVHNNGLYVFVSRGTVCVEMGYLVIEPAPTSAPATGVLPVLKRGEAVWSPHAEMTEGKTKPPPRYTDASVLAAMQTAGAGLDDAKLRRALKDAGLGTPATRAAILESLLGRGYAQREGRLLVPTAHGRALVEAIPVDSLKNAQLTGEWEAKLAQVARGEYGGDLFMREVQTLTRQIVQAICAAGGPHPGAQGPGAAAGPAARHNHQLPACPACHRARLIRGRTAWGCPRHTAGCRFRIPFRPFDICLDEASLCALVRRGRAGPLPRAGHAAAFLKLDVCADPALCLLTPS